MLRIAMTAWGIASKAHPCASCADVIPIGGVIASAGDDDIWLCAACGVGGVLAVSVVGRPAPQGSKKLGEHGQLRESSAYLPAWRAAVKTAVYARYLELGIPPGALPLLRGPIAMSCTFYLPGDRRADGPPDLDKLLRATWDALTSARAWEDDGRVAQVNASKQVGLLGWTGADIRVWRHEK